jgi:hypothetical protein
MAFERRNWSRNTDAMNTGKITVDSTDINGPALFTYRSDADNSATIAGANYFANAVYDLAVDDLIFASGSDTFQALTVATIDREAGTITTSSTGIASSVGTSNLVNDAVTLAKLEEQTIQAASVTCSSAELLALATTPKTLVAAPGAGKVLHFVGAMLSLDFNSAAYVESGDNLGIKYTDASGVQVSDTIEATGFATATADTITNAVPVKDAIVAATGAVNQALVLDNLGLNWTTGDSPIVVTTYYRVLDDGLA